MGKREKKPTVPFVTRVGQIKVIWDKCVDFFSSDDVPLLIFIYLE